MISKVSFYVWTWAHIVVPNHFSIGPTDEYCQDISIDVTGVFVQKHKRTLCQKGILLSLLHSKALCWSRGHCFMWVLEGCRLYGWCAVKRVSVSDGLCRVKVSLCVPWPCCYVCCVAPGSYCCVFLLTHRWCPIGASVLWRKSCCHASPVC